MNGINKVILIGHLGIDPEVKVLESGRKVANFRMATTETYRDKNGQKIDKTEWHNVVFWGPIAEVVEKYLKKGNPVYVEGKLTTRSYEKDGVTRYVTEILGQNMTMLGSRPQDSSFQKESVGESYPENTEEDDLPF